MAEEMGWAESKLHRIENDKSRVLQRDAKRLLRMYGVDGRRATPSSNSRACPANDIWIVLNEAVIRRVVGGRAVMRPKPAKLRNVALQVLTFSAGEHGAMHGSFSLLEFPVPDDPDKVYPEQQIGGIYTQKPDEAASSRGGAAGRVVRAAFWQDVAVAGRGTGERVWRGSRSADRRSG